MVPKLPVKPLDASSFRPTPVKLFRLWKAYSSGDMMQSPTSPLKGRLPSPLGGRLPKQIQRALPVYIVLIIVVIFLSNFDSLGATVNVAKHKRETSRKSHGSHQVPTKGARFPKKIWQTWKVDALDFEERDLTTARTWTTKNPGHRYEVLTDNNDLYYVETHFGPEGLNRPDIVDMYRSLTAKIIKADILRYLIMYVEGGIYADIDVEDLKPIERWIPDRYNEADIDMVISVEIDQPEFKDHPILGKKSMSFCQWTFLSKPGLPVMLKLVENIMDWLNDLAAQQKVPISDLKLDFDEVISGTGPSAFTIAVLEEMSKREGKEVTWDTFHNLVESKLVGGVLVLTVEAFAAGQGHSDSGNHNARTALVKHHYHASLWPLSHPRYSHPIYGEVEKCNWDPECVKLWDSNKASFDALSPEDRAVRLALAEADAQRLALMPKEEPIAQPQPQAMFSDKPLALFGAGAPPPQPQQQPMLGAPQPNIQPMLPPADPQPQLFGAPPQNPQPVPMLPPAEQQAPQQMVPPANPQPQPFRAAPQDLAPQLVAGVQPASDAKPDAEAKPAAETKPEAEAKPDAVVEPNTETKSDAETNPDAEAKLNPEAKPQLLVDGQS